MKFRYIKNISGLLGSNVISQVILLLSLPTVSLLYDPEDFGKFGIVFSIVSIMAIITLLKSDAYILSLERNNKHYISIYFKSIILSIMLLTTIIFILIIVSNYFFKNNYTKYYFSVEEFIYIFLIVISYNVCQLTSSMFVNKNKIFKLAQTNVARSVFLIFFQILFGNIKLVYGLWYAEFLSRIGQIILMSSTIFEFLSKINTKQIKSGWKNYWIGLKPYSFFAMPASLLSALTQYLPILFMATIVDLKAAGLYFMANRIITIPIGMLSQSVSKAFVAEFVQIESENKIKLIRNTIFVLFSVSLLIVFSYHLLYPLLLKYEPENWNGILDVISIVIFLTIPILTISSISQLFNLLGVQKLLLLTELIKLLFVCSFLLLYQYIGSNAISFYVLLVAIITLGYFIQLLVLIHPINRLRVK
ncbi:oligosaccharide flippase family protein [Rheinheimera sp. MMS21-TC3]|uniref:oligosaccharide flippase family protein n=1 Tax=Rheinheimera sp. MMS21-TC3 TaxID=3072790 RepID=UPI0028C4A731|nr:oligosaccharide flippase family protein [Rheinheimera sp. MMS21-TC3]WNO61700.1 oligosaccharide flippase family protein [Rheinheimera sp. MMS21-TC3]